VATEETTASHHFRLAGEKTRPSNAPEQVAEVSRRFGPPASQNENRLTFWLKSRAGVEPAGQVPRSTIAQSHRDINRHPWRLMHPCVIARSHDPQGPRAPVLLDRVAHRRLPPDHAVRRGESLSNLHQSAEV